MENEKRKFKRRPELLPRALPIQDAANYLGIGRTSVYDLIHKGILRVCDPLRTIAKAGRKKMKPLIPREDLDRLIDENILDVPDTRHI